MVILLFRPWVSFQKTRVNVSGIQQSVASGVCNPTSGINKNPVFWIQESMHYRKSESINIESRIQVSLRLPHRCTHTCCQEYQIELSTKLYLKQLILLTSSCSRKRWFYVWNGFTFSFLNLGRVISWQIAFSFFFFFFFFNCILIYQLPFQAQDIKSEGTDFWGKMIRFRPQTKNKPTFIFGFKERF